jgi:hypothetical protein
MNRNYRWEIGVKFLLKVPLCTHKAKDNVSKERNRHK